MARQTKLIAIPVTDEEKQKIKDAAKAKGVTLAAFIKFILFEAIENDNK